MTNLNFYYRVVEEAIAKLGLDPTITRTKNAGKWTLTKAGIPVWIDIIFVQNENRCYFSVASPVVKMNPAHASTMALDLLEINRSLYGVSFCKNKEQVFIKTIREAEGLDKEEAFSMIVRVGEYANHHKKMLSEKYPERTPIGFKMDS